VLLHFIQEVKVKMCTLVLDPNKVWYHVKSHADKHSVQQREAFDDALY